MNQIHDTIAEILYGYPDLTQEQNAILLDWLTADPRNQQIFDMIMNGDNVSVKFQRIELLRQQNEASWDKLNTAINVAIPKKRSIWGDWKMVAAASVIFLMAIGGYMWFSQNKVRPDVSSTQTKQTMLSTRDVSPGGVNARLILADGRSINLDSNNIGKLVQQGDVTVLNQNGQLSYIINRAQVSKERGTSSSIYNTLETSKGQTFAITLSDGTKVWLNSEASFRYPVVFTESERKVVISGEAYFEVAKGDKPFIVTGIASPGKQNWAVQVLGTHFNINAYSDEEAVKTTLLEGKVKITSGASASILRPGQQAQLKASNELLKIIDNVDVDQVIAWKNGYFQFNNEDLRTVMKKISRWYGIEVSYRGSVPSDTYAGRIKRNSKLSEVLALFEQNGVHFTIEGNKVVIN